MPESRTNSPARLQSVPSTADYFFNVENKKLIFNLKLNLSNPKALRSFLDIVDVTELHKTNPQIIINYAANEVKIIFPQIDTPQPLLSHKLIEFIEKLNEHNILEKHENPKALWFYSDNNGDEILKFRNYPSTLQAHLAKEREVFFKLLTRPDKKYTLLVEVGCGAELENISIAKKAESNYLGIEFSPSAAHTAQQKIPHHPLTATVKCFNILKISSDKLALKPEDKPLFIFPFNLVGNIAPISLLFSKLRAFSYDFVISIYRLDSATENMRREYYTNCGYKNIQVQADTFGNVTFSSEDGLYSVAYSDNYLIPLLTELGFDVVKAPCSQHGLMLYAKAIPFAVKARMEHDQKGETPTPILTGFKTSQLSPSEVTHPTNMEQTDFSKTPPLSVVRH